MKPEKRGKKALDRADRILAAARQRIVLFAAVFIGLFLFILGLEALSPTHGLLGRYYANESWLGLPALTRTDPVISFDKETMSKRSGNIDRSSAIWEGYIFVFKSSTYRFTIDSDDGSWVYLDDTLLIDNGGIHPESREKTEIYLSRGNHRLRVKYFDAGGKGKIDFRWAAIRTPRIVLPLPSFYLRPVSSSVVVADTVLTFAVFLLKLGFLSVGLFILVLVLGILFPTLRRVSLLERKAAAWNEKMFSLLSKEVIIIPAILIGLFLIILRANDAVHADIAFFKFINGHHTPFLDGLFSSLTNLGNGWFVIPIFFVFLHWKIPKKVRTRIIVAAALALSLGGVGNNIVKSFVDRPRPIAYFASPSRSLAAEEPRPYAVHVLGDPLYDHSFPSGHANTAFTLATLMALIFGIRFWPLFLAAMGVAYSRVYIGAHFPSDVLAGAFMGSVITLAAWYGVARVARRKGRPIQTGPTPPL